MISKSFSGSAIVLTVLGIAAVTTVALGVAQLVPRDFRQSQALESSLQAENAAWAGVEHALLLLKSAQENNEYFSLSASAEAPYGAYQAPARGDNCIDDRAACPGFDRQLGNLQNGQPATFLRSLSTPGDEYSLVVWHMRRGVGNTGINSLDDGLPAAINQFKEAPNMNPVLDRDEVRRLDVNKVTSVTIDWKPIWNNQCKYDNGHTKIWLYYTLLNDKNEVIERNRAEATSVQGMPIKPARIAEAKTLSLRLLATNTTNLDPRAVEDDANVRGCFIRYNLNTGSTQNNQAAIDMGFDVIESTGVSGGVRRKIRVVVNRENGRLLNILDFGLACENCTGLD